MGIGGPRHACCPISRLYPIQGGPDSPDEFWSIAVPGVLTGVGTLALAAVTVVLAYQERVRDDGLRREDRKRADQRLEQARNQELVRARREQAESVAAWTPGRWRIPYSPIPRDRGIAVNIVNPSQQLVYDVLVVQVFVQGAGPHRGEDWLRANLSNSSPAAFKALISVPPGRWAVELDYQGQPPMGVIGIELGFTDRADSHWIRRASGQLEEIDVPAAEHYGLARRLSYTLLLPEYIDPDPARPSNQS